MSEQIETAAKTVDGGLHITLYVSSKKDGGVDSHCDENIF